MDKPATMASVRKIAQKHGCEFFKGRGYFYFSGKNFRDDSVMVCHVNQLTDSQWEAELVRKIEALRA